MKLILKLLTLLILMSAVITKVVAATDEGIATKDLRPNQLDRPYIVEVIDAEGNSAGEFRGLSQKTDPFLISEELGAGPFVEDKFSAFPDIKMGIGSKIVLNRAPDFQIKDGKKEKTVRSWVKTVGELLAEYKVELGADDKINFSTSTELTIGMSIIINRVAKTTVVESESVEYKTVKKSNPNVEKGNKKTLQTGKNGKRNKFYLVTREDGEEVSRKFLKSEIAEEPVEEIVEVGTKVVVYGSGVASIWKSSPDMVSACNFVSRGTRIHVVNLDNGKSIDVTCMGGGLRSDRIVDLSDTAFQALGGSWSQGLLKNVRAEKYYPTE